MTVIPGPGSIQPPQEPAPEKPSQIMNAIAGELEGAAAHFRAAALVAATKDANAKDTVKSAFEHGLAAIRRASGGIAKIYARLGLARVVVIVKPPVPPDLNIHREN